MDNIEISAGAYMTMTFIFVYFILFFGTGIAIGRQENSIREFYLPLREKYKHSYVKANKVVRFVRKFYGLKKDVRSHWLTCLLHYLQIAMVITPVLMLPVFIFLPSEKAAFIWGISGLIPGGLLIALLMPFALLQIIRCSIIKKTDSKYSKCEFHNRYS